MIDLNITLNNLAERRPVFYSEADFQHALAWEIKKQLPDNVVIHLEYPKQDMHLDIYLTQFNRYLAIELKYKTRATVVQTDSEKITLKNQSAQNIGRYDFIKDIYRLEQVLEADPNGIGYAILLTNDSAYWKSPRNKQTVDADFRLHNGRTLNGNLDWHNVSESTIPRRKIIIKGHYPLQWRDYITIDAKAYNRFRYLLVPVTS